MKKMKKIFSILLSSLMLVSFIVPQSLVLADDGTAYEQTMEQAAPEIPAEEPAPEVQAEIQPAAPEDASLPVQTEAEAENENAPPAEAATEPAPVEAETQPETQAETQPEPQMAADPYQGAAIDISALHRLDFSSCRILVGTQDTGIFTDPSVIVSSYNGIYLLQLTSQQEAARAYAYYFDKADFVEVDTAVVIADGGAEGASETVMTPEENPFKELGETERLSGFDIALIDTGAAGANASVSMIGENTEDENGHGSLMLSYIREQNAAANVLSIKALDANGAGEISAVYAAIQYAIESNVRIINLSLSALASPDSRIIETAIQDAVSRGILVVGAAGNNGADASYYIPGKITEAIITGAADEKGVKLAASNYGESVDYNVMAPSTSQAAAIMSGFLSAHDLAAVDSVLGQGLFFSTAEPEPEPEVPAEGGISTKNTSLCVSIPYGKGSVQALDEFTFKVTPEEGYRVWRVRGLTRYMEYTDNVSEDGDIYVVNENTEHLRVYFVTEEEYAQILASAGSEENLRYYWDNPEWFHRFGTRMLTEQEFGEVYGERIQGQKQKVMDNGGVVAADSWAINFPAINYRPVVGETWSAYALPNPDNAYQWDTFYFQVDPNSTYNEALRNLGWITVYCVEPGQAQPTTRGILNFVVEQVWDGGYSGRVWYYPDNIGMQTSVTTFGGTYTNGFINVFQQVSQRGRIAVKKELTAGSAPNQTFDFKITYLAPDGDSGARRVENFTLRPNETKYFIAEPGTPYVVEEINIPEGFEPVGETRKTGKTPILDKMKVKFNYDFKILSQADIDDNTGRTSWRWHMNGDAPGDNSWAWDQLDPSYKVLAIRANPNRIDNGDGTFRGRYATDRSKSWDNWDEKGVWRTTTYFSEEDRWIIDPYYTYINTGLEGYIWTIYRENNVSIFHHRYTHPDVEVTFQNRVKGYMNLQKSSARPQITNGNSNYSLAGAVYTVYSDAACTNAVKTLTTNANGSTPTIVLPLGTYYVKETTAARNYLLDTTRHTVTIQASHTSSSPNVLSVTDAPKTGWLQAHKTSKDTSVTNGNSNYSLRGAQFTVYNSANTAVGTLTVADNGDTNKLELALGTYTVKETRAPENGYTIDAEWAAGKQFTVTADHTEAKPLVANAADTPIVPVFKLKKSSSNPQLTNNNPIYSLAGAVYTVYKDAACTNVVKTMTTDANGDTAAVSLPLGTYYVKETTAAHNYKLDTERYTVTLTTAHTSSNPYVLRVTDIPKNGWLQIYKYSSDTSVSDGNDNYALRGAKFTIYNSENAVAGTLIVGENGYTEKIELLPGEYLVKETGKPERGYKIDPEWAAGKRFTVTAENTEAQPLVVRVGDIPITPSVKLKKTSANPQISDDNACYSLAGAVYTVYKNAACTQRAATLTTDSLGNTQTIQLPLGTYYVKETKAAQNYMLDPTVYPVTLKEEHTEANPYVLSVNDIPGSDPGVIELTKESNVDYATMFPLEGAQFEIKYFDNTAGNTSGTPKRTWVIETKYDEVTDKYVANLKESYLVEGSDALYTDNGTAVIPVGTISVEEIKPAQGYTLTDATLKDDDGNEIALVDGKYISTITMQNGMAKLNYGNYYTMLNTPIEIHTAAANIADGSHYAKADGPVRIVDTITMAGTDAERLINADGEWDYIHYRLKGELREVGTNRKIADMTDPVTGRPYRNFVTDDFDGNKEFMECVIEDPEVLASLEGKTLYIAENLYTVITKNVDGQRQEIETLVATEDESRFPDAMDLTIKESQRIHFPMIRTTFEGEGVTYKTVMKNITLTDTITYKSLIPGHTYKVSGVLMDKETGKEIKDDNGNRITAEKTFRATDLNGTVTLTFTFPAVLLHGKTVVAFETCYENKKEICVHQDLEDEDQTVTFEPSEIATTLTERESGEHEALVSEELTLVDTVSFSGLATDAEYTLKGVLMDKATGKPILDDKGKEIRAEKKFTPPTENGVIEMEFTFPAVLMHGKTVVAFEELTYGTKPITEHKDLNDEGQTVTFMPSEIATTLTERESGEHEALVSEELTLVDTVSFSGLATDAEYTLKGVLMDKATGKPILDDKGKEIRAEKKFTPPTENGVIEMEFTFPAVLMHGKTLVAFEELLYGTKPVTEHKDLTDEGQTLNIIPTEIGTTFYNPAAEDAEDEEGLHTIFVGKKVKLIDTVAYTGAAVGTEYTMTGTIMDQETGSELLNSKGKPYTKEVTFTPTKPDGTVKLTFTIDAEVVYDGKILVAFEELTYQNKLIAKHKDLDDEGQTVEVLPPELHTTLIDDETHTHVANAFRTLTLTDTVEYKGLVKGTEYELKGTLMNKETGKPAVDSKGESITAASKFKAEATEGTAEVVFTFENRELMGGTLVAFEQLYEAGTQIADHEDLEDENQSVRLPYIGTTLTLNDTSKRFHPVSDLQLNDAVALNNLDLQTTYIVRGYLVDQTSGRYLKADGTGTKDKSEAMVKEVKFLASKHDARLNVEFALNASNIDFDIVCFEELYAVGTDDDGNETVTLVAEHADIEDDAQTVRYEPAPKTGDTTNTLLWIVLEMAALAGIALAGTIAVKKMHR